MSNSDQVWEDYLSRRPSLSKWIHHCLESEVLKANYLGLITDMQNEVKTGEKTKYDKKVADLDDNEALAHFVYFGTCLYNDNQLLVDSKAVKHAHQPSISLEEARYMDSKREFSYVGLLCVREFEGDFTSNESLGNTDFIDDIIPIINYYRIHKFHHIVWDTEQDLVRTVVRYKNYRNLFKVYTDSDILIDSDYLDNYLLAPKPDPIEIDKNTWHDMSVRLINWLDEENEKTKDTRFLNNDLPGFMADGLASCFLTHSLEDLSFMETIYDFCVFASNYPEFMNRNVRESYHPGMLDPELFDLLREHEAVFVRPLLEQALKD